MRALIVTLGLLTAATAHAQTTQFYDERGLPSGRAESYGNQTNFYDSRGLPAGRSENYGAKFNIMTHAVFPLVVLRVTSGRLQAASVFWSTR